MNQINKIIIIARINYITKSLDILILFTNYGERNITLFHL